MAPAGADAAVFQESLSPIVYAPHDSDATLRAHAGASAQSSLPLETRDGRRRTPRKSLIVVLPDNHIVSPDDVSAHLPEEETAEEMDVILACAGQPTSLGPLQRRIRALQILLAPAGTSGEDLREMAMSQAPGDIITLLSGTPT